ncbi:uncharacterized protein isoform X2 [Rhodnius prolixus]|uniref:uncharacterized protein isoform X2 n=1 Tax=Rhodnius prolixus TaxID=13249 RepID=UPI003D18E4D7
MENSIDCTQCIQLSKRVKEEKVKNNKKKNLINLFKELLYAHDIKLSNFSRTNLRDVYNKYLIDGEHVRQRLSSTLSSLNEITEAYSAANQSNEVFQKKAQDLEAKLKHLEFLNKQLSDYYNQVETQNKKQKTESKSSKTKKDSKKTEKKLNLKVELKSGSPSPIDVRNDKDVNFHSNNTDFSAENSVTFDENSTEERRLDNATSNAIEVSSNLDTEEQDNLTLEQELLKAKDVLDSFSDSETHTEYLDTSDEEDLRVTETSSVKQLLTSCLPDLNIMTEKCNVLVNGYKKVSSEETVKFNATNKFGSGNVLKNGIYNSSSPVDSGIFSANTSPAISDTGVEQDLDCEQEIFKGSSRSMCSNSLLKKSEEVIKESSNTSNCAVDNIFEQDNSGSELPHLTNDCNDSISSLKLVGENVNLIVDHQTVPNIISPLRSLKKNTANNCKNYSGNTHNSITSSDQKHKDIREINESNVMESSQIGDSINFSRDTTKYPEENNESIFFIDEEDENNKTDNIEQINDVVFTTTPESTKCERLNEKKTFIRQNCIFPESKLSLPKPETMRPSSSWFSADENLNWVEKLKLQDSNTIDCDYLCKNFSKSMKLKRRPMKKGKPQKQTNSTLYNNLFKSVTSNGLARNSSTCFRDIKSWANFRVFGDFTEKSGNNENSWNQDDFYTYPNNENLFSNEHTSKKYFSHLRRGFKANYDSFFKYRDNFKEKHTKSQSSLEENKKNSDSLTVTYRLVANDLGYPSHDEILKFTLIHPIVKIIGLKDTCVVVNSLFDLTAKIRMFIDELDRFYEAYTNKKNDREFPSSQWNCQSFFNEHLLDSKHKLPNMKYTCCNGMCERETAFGRVHFHQRDFQTINNPNWNCCQTLYNNINPLLMKTCCNPNSNCNQENIGNSKHNEKCNTSELNNCDRATSALNESLLVSTNSFPTHLSNSRKVARELDKNVSSENTIAFTNVSQKSVLEVCQPNSPESVTSSNIDIPEKSRFSIVTSQNCNNSQELGNKMKKLFMKQIEKPSMIENIQKTETNGFKNVAGNETEHLSYCLSFHGHDCQNAGDILKKDCLNKGVVRFNESQLSRTKPDECNLSLNGKVCRNDGQRMNYRINSGKIAFKDKISLKTNSNHVNSPVEEVDLMNNLSEEVVKNVANEKLESNNVKTFSKVLLRKSLLTPVVSKNNFCKINNNDCHKKTSNASDAVSSNSTSSEKLISEQVEIVPTPTLLKSDRERSSKHPTKGNESDSKITVQKDRIFLERHQISSFSSNEKFKDKERKLVDNSHSVTGKNKTFQHETKEDGNSVKKICKNSFSDLAGTQNRPSNQIVNLKKKNSEIKADVIDKEHEESNEDSTLKTTKNTTGENEIPRNVLNSDPLETSNKSTYHSNQNSGKINCEDITKNVDQKNENDSINKSGIKHNSAVKSKKESTTNKTSCSQNIVTKVKTSKKIDVTETDENIKEIFGNEVTNSKEKVGAGIAVEEEELSAISVTVTSIMKEYKQMRPLSPLPEIDMELVPEHLSIVASEHLSPVSDMMQNCNTLDHEEEPKSLLPETCSSLNNPSVCNGTTELGNLNMEKIHYFGKTSEELSDLNVSLDVQINNNGKCNTSENNNELMNCTVSQINVSNDIIYEETVIGGSTQSLVVDTLVCQDVMPIGTISNTGTELINNKSSDDDFNGTVNNQNSKCSTSLTVLNLKEREVSELRKESLPTSTILHQEVNLEEKDNNYNPNIYDVDYIEGRLINNDLELSGVCSSTNEAEFPKRSEIGELANRGSSCVELRSTSCSSIEEAASDILNPKTLISVGKEMEHSPSKEADNSTLITTIKDRLRPRKSSLAVSPVRVYSRRLNRKSCSPKHNKLSNVDTDEIEKSLFKKKEVISEINIYGTSEELSNAESKLEDISINQPKHPQKSEDERGLNELYQEISDLIPLDFKADETKLSFDSQTKLCYLPTSDSSVLDVNINVRNEEKDKTRFEKERCGSDERKEQETQSICIGFYRDISEEKEGLKSTTQNESESKKESPNFMNDSDLHSGNPTYSNELDPFRSTVSPLLTYGRKADKRKVCSNDSNFNSKVPRTISSQEIVECKGDNAMRVTLRYITDKLLQEGKPPTAKKKKSVIKISDKRIKSYIDSYVATSSENCEKLHAIIDELSIFDVKIVASVILETIIGDKQEMMAPIGSNRMPPLTQVQKRLLMLTISLAQHNKQVYDEVLNSLEESLASFRDKTLNVANGCKMIFFYTVLCRSQGFLSRARSLLLDVLYTRNRKAFPVVLKMVTIWPFLIPHASFSSGCLLTSVFIYILSSPYTGTDKTAKREAAALKKNIMTKYGYNERGQESRLTRDELFREILSRITERGSGLALLLLAKFEGNIWATKMVESSLVPLLQKWLHAEKTANGNTSNDNVAAEIALALGRIVRGFPKLSSRILINNSIKIFEHMLNETNNFAVMEAVAEALVMLRRHNLPMCAATLAKWHPKENVITTRIIELIRSVLSVKPLTQWLSFLSRVD